jgi:hypothetical protein
VRFPLRRLQKILERSGIWTGSDGRLIDVHTIPRASRPYPDAVLVGTKGRSVVDADSLRDEVDVYARALYPSKYPSAGATASGFLPSTLPSSRVDIDTRGGVTSVVGRGWGHGVGMSQWGAYGLARRGADHDEILTHYYTGVDIDTVSHRGAIDVGIDWGRSDVAVRGAFNLLDGRDRVLVRGAVGTWRFSWTDEGIVSVDPPRGYRLPLRVGVVRAPSSALPGEPARLTIALSRPAVVRALSQDGTEPAPGAERVLDAGRRVVVWRAPTDSGRYEVRIEAASGGVSRQSEAVEIMVASDARLQPPGVQEEQEEGDVVVPVLVAVVLLILGGAAGLARRMRA